MKTEQVAPGVTRISLAPFDSINAYIVDDVLVDAGARMHARGVLGLLPDRTMRAHALTHCHFDHQGSSHYICAELGIPLWCGAGDRSAVETGDHRRLYAQAPPLARWFACNRAGPAHPVAHALREGDIVGGFEVLETPGHTPGHLAYWRESDRVLILGDVLFHRNPITWRKGLREPFAFATGDAAQNRASARRLAALNPAIICFGHGAPLRDGEVFKAFVAQLP